MFGSQNLLQRHGVRRSNIYFLRNCLYNKISGHSEEIPTGVGNFIESRLRLLIESAERRGAQNMLNSRIGKAIETPVRQRGKHIIYHPLIR